jgi:Bacterial Ig-like domain
MSEPTTALHYTANGNFVSGQYMPGADGFNMADVSSPGELSEVPAGDKALVYLGMTGGVTAAFEAAVEPYIGNSQVYGFYLADEPAASATTAANFKAESDWIHANDPGAKTFIIEENSSSDTTPQYYYTPANSDIDLFGLDPYPVNTNVPGNYDLNTIPLAVQAAESIGIPQKDVVPVYQAFGGGGYASWILPTAAQEQAILSEWGSVTPNPAFDYAYSWGSQDGDTALSQDTALQQVFAAHNAGSGGTTGNGSGGTTGGSAPAAPTIGDSSIQGGIVNAANDTAAQTLSGTAGAGDTVTVYLNGSATPSYSTVASSSGAWSVKIGVLANGAYSYTATATDPTGDARA